MTAIAEALIPTDHLTLQQRDECLLTLARYDGNSARASEALKEHGYDVPAATLRYWRLYGKSRERYLDLVSGLERKSAEEGLKQALKETAAENLDLAEEIRVRLRGRLDELSAKELVSAQREVMIPTGIALEKYLLIDDRPTQIIETRNPDWFDQKLQEALDGQIVDAEVVSEEQTEGPGGPAILRVSTQETREP